MPFLRASTTRHGNVVRLEIYRVSCLESCLPCVVLHKPHFSRVSEERNRASSTWKGKVFLISSISLAKWEYGTSTIHQGRHKALKQRCILRQHRRYAQSPLQGNAPTLSLRHALHKSESCGKLALAVIDSTGSKPCMLKSGACVYAQVGR